MPVKGLVHVLEDQADLRASLVSRLRSEGFVVVVYEKANPFLDVLPRLSPGCVLSNIRLDGIDGLKLLRQVKESGRSLAVILITSGGDVPLAVEAMKLGASDFLEEPLDMVRLTRAVEAALDQALVLEENHDLVRQVATLTSRERQVFDHIVRGHSNKVIAQYLSISPRTVEIYRANVMLKLGVASLTGLIRRAVKSGLA